MEFKKGDKVNTRTMGVGVIKKIKNDEIEIDIREGVSVFMTLSNLIKYNS